MSAFTPPWVETARKYIGLTEIPGKATHPTIRKWLIDLKAWWQDDETPWCGTFIGAVMREQGIALPKHWYRAKAWADWGTPLPTPRFGCVVVFERTGGGHVGIVVGVDRSGRLMVLGGNQSNSVNVAPFDRSRVLAYRAPPGFNLYQTPPLIESGAASSRNEA